MGDIRSLINKILEDPTSIEDDTNVVEIKKKLSPFGIITPKDESFINISVVNMSEKYQKRIIMVGLVGYVFRTLEEYEFDPSLKDLKELQSIEDAKQKQIRRNEMEEEFQRDKLGAMRFFRRHFSYDPDRHIKSSYTENKDDPERISRYEAYRKTMANAEHFERYANNLPEIKDELKDLLLRTYSTVGRFKDTLKNVYNVLPTEAQNLLSKEVVEIGDIYAELKPVAESVSAADTQHVYTNDIPSNVFYHLGRYIDNHYEDIQEAVRVLYGEKPDIELAIQYYDHFSNEQAAKDHRDKYESDVISSIYTIQNGSWYFLGPFKKNRERLEFYNKNTEVIKEMFKQIEADQKAGREILEDVVKNKKKKNIIEAGPDDPGLSNYTQAINNIESLGAKKYLTSDEKRQLTEAIRTKEDFEVPEDTVQTEIYSTDPEKGFTKKKIYVKSKPPMLEPEKEIEPDPKSKLHSKILKSRTGEVKPVSQLKPSLGGTWS